MTLLMITIYRNRSRCQPIPGRRGDRGGSGAAVDRDGVVAAGDERLAVPGARSARRARGRRPRSARRSRRGRSPRPSWKPATSAPPAPTWRAQPATSAACVPGGVNSGTLPAITHRVERAAEVERREVVLDPLDRRAPRARAVASIDASTSTPTTEQPAPRELDRDPAGAAARRRAPTRATGSSESTNAASPCTSTPLAASASNRAWYSSPSQVTRRSSRTESGRDDLPDLLLHQVAVAAHAGDHEAERCDPPPQARHVDAQRLVVAAVGAGPVEQRLLAARPGRSARRAPPRSAGRSTERNTVSPRWESWPCSSSVGHHRVAARVRGQGHEAGAQAGVVDREAEPVLDAARARRRCGFRLDEQQARDAEPLELVDPVGLFGPAQDHDVLRRRRPRR